MTNTRADKRLPNYLRAHRQRTGLSQREIGEVLGYEEEGIVSRHEKFQSAPPIEIAIGYELLFRVPVSEMFAGVRDGMEEQLKNGLARLEEELGRRSARDRTAIATARKLMWISEWKSTD